MLVVIMSEATAFDDLIRNLRDVFFALRAIADAMNADLDCSAAERGLLVDLGRHGPQTVPKLAAARAVSRQAMQKSVDRLADRGWLEGEITPVHRRSVLIGVTRAGRAV